MAGAKLRFVTEGLTMLKPLAPVALKHGATVGTWNLRPVGKRYFPLGDPDFVRRYVRDLALL